MKSEPLAPVDEELREAALAGDLTRLRAALDMGADGRFNEPRGYGPLGAAVLGGSPECLRELIGRLDARPRDRRLNMAKLLATDMRLDAMLEVLEAHALAERERRILMKVKPKAAKAVAATRRL